MVNNLKKIDFRQMFRNQKKNPSLNGSGDFPHPPRSIGYFLDRLFNQPEVVSFMRYRGNDVNLVQFGLFRQPTLVVSKITLIFQMIQLDDPAQQESICDFFLWLSGIFQPFLAHIEQSMPDVRAQVDGSLSKMGCPRTILRKHLTIQPFMMLLMLPIPFLFRQKLPVKFSKMTSITGVAMAHFHGKSCKVSPSITFTNMQQLSRTFRKPFYRYVLTISAAQFYLINRLIRHEFQVVLNRNFLSILTRVLSQIPT